MRRHRLRCVAPFFFAASLTQQACGDGSTAPDPRGTRLILTTEPPATALNGAALTVQPVVQVRNAIGQVVARAGIPITATISVGGTLRGNLTAFTTADGSATFTDLAISGALGQWPITFSSPGLTSATATVVLTAGFNVRQLPAGGGHTCGLTPYGAVYCWGENWDGELGNGTRVHRASAGPVNGGTDYQSISAGQSHMCGVQTGGAAFCWGSNYFGQLGNDSPFFFGPMPAQVAGGLSFQSLSSGAVHTCGLTIDGAAYCWGRNENGELGDGTTTRRSTPVAVTRAPTFRSLTAGSEHTCGLTTDNSAYCWGDNGAGQLGDGTTVNRLSPVAVSGALRFESLDAGYYHTCGLRNDGAAFCWGSNFFGQVSGATAEARLTTPTAVPGGLSFRSITAGGGHSCGVGMNGAGYCWGSDGQGQRGNGTESSSSTAVAGGLVFQSIFAGDFHSCGVTVGGIAYCWGQNTYGGVGDGTTIHRQVPVPVRWP